MSICKALAKPTPLTFRVGLNPSSCAPKSNAGCISPAPGAAPGTLEVFAGCRGSWGSLCPQLVTPAHLAWPRNTPRRARSLETVRQEGQRHQPSVQPGPPAPSIRAEDAVGALQPPGLAPRAAPVSCSPPRRSQLCGYLLHDQLTESSLRLALLLRGRALFSIHRSKSKGGRE